MSKSPKANKADRLMLRLDRGQREAFEAAAEMAGKSLSEWVRDACASVAWMQAQAGEKLKAVDKIREAMGPDRKDGEVSGIELLRKCDARKMQTNGAETGASGAPEKVQHWNAGDREPGMSAKTRVADLAQELKELKDVLARILGPDWAKLMEWDAPGTIAKGEGGV